MAPDSAMGSAAFRHRVFRFGRYTFDEANQELWRDGVRRKLEAKPRALLAALLAQPSVVVTKRDLIEAVWPNKKFVDPGSLATAAYNLRTALDPDGQTIIETVPGIGYKIAVPVDVSFVEVGPQNLSALLPARPVPGRPQWRLERKLSAGAAQDVWLARHERTTEARVFKFAATQERLDGLKREVALSRLLQLKLGDRPDIVRVLEWNFREAPFYVEMPYGGPDLRAWFEAQGGLKRVEPTLRITMVADIARTVGDAHDAGVLHGDIKPANILVAEAADGSLTRLIDFGAGGLTPDARTEALSETLFAVAEQDGKSRTGTFLYMAPEALSGGQSTAAADIYSLGILLYQMVVGDLDRPLSAGWEEDVSDEILRRLIGGAASGEPGRRLKSAGWLADELLKLDETRAQFARDSEAAAAAAALAEQARRARQRRPWIVLAAAGLALGALVSTVAAFRYASARNEAQRQARLAEAIDVFLTQDLLTRGNARFSGKANETLMEAVARAEPRILERFGGEPRIAANLYLTLALVYNNRSAAAEARTAYDHAVEEFEKADGPHSADADNARLHRASMEAYARNGASRAAANALLSQVENDLPFLGDRQSEIRAMWLNAKGAMDLADGNSKAALDAFRGAEALMAALPDKFDKEALLRIQLREGQALSDLGEYGAASEVFAANARSYVDLHGPNYPDALIAGVEQAQALGGMGEDGKCLDTINAIYPNMITVLGAQHINVMFAAGVRADCLKRLGRYDEAAREYWAIHDTAVAVLGPHTFKALNALSGLGDSQCRAGNVVAGLAAAREAVESARAEFGPKDSNTQAFTTGYALCLIKDGQYQPAMTLLSDLDRKALSANLNDSYVGETVDMLEAAASYGLGDRQRVRDLLKTLREAFAKPGGDVYFRHWTETLTAATAN